MAGTEEAAGNGAEIKDTDIVFDCPYCGKSLAIDYRGCGLTIQCADCGRDVVVPIPEGMELSDIDSTPEDQELRILNLRRTLAAAEEKITEQEAAIEELGERRRELENARLEYQENAKILEEEVTAVRKALAVIYESLDRISGIYGSGE